jgi:uncharacterized protein
MMREIDVKDLLGNPGHSKTVHVTEPVPGLRTELADVPEEAAVEGDLLLESVVEGILVSGELRGPLALRCSRCLKKFGASFDVDVSELFVTEPDPETDEYPLRPEGTLDPEQMVRDAVVPTLPFAPLCTLDCLGLCERCGGDRNLGECACSEVPGDPRLALLADLEALFGPDEGS